MLPFLVVLHVQRLHQQLVCLCVSASVFRGTGFIPYFLTGSLFFFFFLVLELSQYNSENAAI